MQVKIMEVMQGKKRLSFNDFDCMLLVVRCLGFQIVYAYGFMRAICACARQVFRQYCCND